MQVKQINPAKTAMIVVDMQNDFVAAGAAMETPAARAMVPKLADALRICREAGTRVIYTAHVHRRDGCDMVCSTTCIRRSPIVTLWWTARQGWTSILNLLRCPESMSLKSIDTAVSSARTSILSCVSGTLTPSSSREPRPKTAVMPQRAMRCSATTGWCFFQTRQRPMTIRIAASDRCQMPTFIMPLWLYSQPQPRMSCRWRI
jgi:hypothetical protein